MRNEKNAPTPEPAATETGREPGGFSPEEKAAMRIRAEELRAQSQRGARSKRDGESDVLAKIAEMAESDRQMATRLHEIVTATAPGLSPRTWYGMPAYAREGKVVCFFQNAERFKSRYATLGFNDSANLDEGDMWPTSFAVKRLTPAVEKTIAALVKKAAG